MNDSWHRTRRHWQHGTLETWVTHRNWIESGRQPPATALAGRVRCGEVITPRDAQGEGAAADETRPPPAAEETEATEETKG